MTKAQWLDLLERSFWTFIQTFVGVILATGLLDAGSTDLTAWKAAAIAAAFAGFKAAIAQQFGTGTAATLPAKDEPVYQGDADNEWGVVSEEDLEAIGETVDEGEPESDA